AACAFGTKNSVAAEAAARVAADWVKNVRREDGWGSRIEFGLRGGVGGKRLQGGRAPMATLCHVCRCLTNRKRPSKRARRMSRIQQNSQPVPGPESPSEGP